MKNRVVEQAEFMIVKGSENVLIFIMYMILKKMSIVGMKRGEKRRNRTAISDG